MATKAKATTTSFTTLPLDSIRPYWRNPKNATEDDIAKVMTSIERYGYQSPIIVDPVNVIIVGHTRYMALRRLGWTEAPVLVSDLPTKLAQEYRIIDNRSGELVAWDRAQLLLELREFTADGMVELFFPDMDLGININVNPWDADDMAAGERALDRVVATPDVEVQELTCPHCHQTFEVQV